MAENSEGASGLSAEAKVFIPRQANNHGDGHMTIQQIPSYMMNCYPFVQSDFVRNRAPWFGNNRGRGYHGHQGNRKQRSFGGHHGNRMPQPHNFPGDFHMPYHPGMPPPPMDMPWNGILPMNPMMLSSRLDCNTQPSGVPFDGGTKSPDPPGMGSGGTGEKHRKQNSGKQDNSKYRKPDTNNNRGAASTGAWEVEDRRKKSRNGQRGRSEVGSKVNAWSDGKDTPRTVICKEISVQTDFPDRIANSTLQQKPSPLFVSKRHYHGNSNLDSSDSDLDSDSGYSSPLHKRNQVSNGTHPAGFIETITFTKSPPVQSESKTVEAAKSVPQPKMSYAMIAQKVPTSSSHNTCVHTENLSSSNTGCDNRSKDKNSNHDPHWSKEGKTGANKNNSSVHCDANVTNNNDGKSADEDNGIERVNAVGEKKKRKRNRKRKKKKGDGDKVEDNDVVEKEDVELHFEDEEEFPDLLGSGNKKLSREITPGSRESNQSVIEDRINLESDENLVMSTPVSYLQKQNNDYSGTPWKTHSGHQNAWNGSGRREITPNVWKNRTVVDDTSVVDVGPVIDPGYQESTPMGTVIESPGVMGTPSYSEILKTDRKSEEQKINAPQKQLKKPPHKSAAHQNTSGQTDNADLSETRATRKRRKRREMMNQAAEEELAEISLEQDMLRELNLNPKSKVSKPAPKSTVKESNSPQPGILHANPSQLSGGGKKSKQLIALDLGAMIDALEKKKDVTDHDQSHVSNQPSMKKKQENQVRSKPHNILDASAPVVKRGKERENPKPKKPSPLKKVILKEREEKKQLRLLEENMPENTGAPVGIGVVSAESDLSQDAMSYKGSADYGVGTPASNDLSPISQTSSISMSPLSPGASPLSSEVNSPVAGQIGREAILKIHSRRFREYCNQVLNKDIDNSCTALLQDLVRFQDRVYHRDPTKAKIKRRIVLGLREVTKHLKLKKIKCVIISPNLEKIQSKGGLDDALNNILNLCNQQDIPFVFALGRRSLGRACAKLVPVSVVGIFSYEGTETNFRHLMELTEQARQSYKEMVSVIEKEIREYPTRGSAASAPHIYAHMGHSRTPSGASVLSFTSSILSEPISENYPHSEPETDSKGYEIVKDVEENFGQFNFSAGVVPNKTITYPTKVSYKIPHKRDIDDGNEADTEDFGEKPRVKGQCQHGLESDKDSDNDSQQGADTVEDLPHIDSIHSSTYDLSTEILSQHSGRTLESCEAMSTHSSRTLGDGSSTILADPGERSSKHDTPKSMESPSSTLQRGKVVDEERIKHWVDETQSRLENLQLQISGTEDSGSSSSESETEENSVDEVETVTCDPQVKVETVSNKNVASINSENQPDIVENVGANDAKIETNLNGSGVYETKDNCVDDVNGSCQKQNASNVSLTMISQGLNRTDPSQNNPVLGQTEVKGCQNTSNDVGERA